jgi:hypothetical protein
MSLSNHADNIIIVEDFVSKEFQMQLQRYIENAEVPLYYNSDTIGNEYTSQFPKDNQLECPQFTHRFIKDFDQKSSWSSYFEPIGFFFNAKTGTLKNEKLFSFKLNVNPRVSDRTPDEHYTIHVDTGFPTGITAIYYVNNSDGDTLFFNETGTEVIKRVTPKQGSIVYFNNQTPHAGQPPVINNYRAVLNFNWV